jgi:SAM-dependent methyltransferase
VIATDISAEMLAFGRERATAAGLDNIEFVKKDASSLDYPADFFDAALSRWGIIFDPDGEAAAARVREMLKGGARFAISSWGPPERVPFLGIAVRTIEERHGRTLPPGLPGPLSRPTPDALAALLEAGGYAEVAVEETSVDFEFDSGRDFAGYVRDIASPVRALIADQPAEVQEETWAAVGAAAPAQPDGSVKLSNLVLLASGSA